ncbi:MAG TPA: toll/interleukin-1 receptor domain-containing protein [Cyclobacteriaceae bacterium]|nr:toll/interleukin-1 receptor domain-containing protein [Cyclobacteriaceae bacterium]
MNEQGYAFDAFISHAVEDKIPIANELCDRLEKKGARIWYCGREFHTGDSIKRAIREGLSKSRYGIVILSKSYLSKSWNLSESLNFIAGERAEKKTILPLLYNIAIEDLPAGNLELTDRFAYRIGDELDELIQHLVAEINCTLPANVIKKHQKFSFLKQGWRLKASWFPVSLTNLKKRRKKKLWFRKLNQRFRKIDVRTVCPVHTLTGRNCLRKSNCFQRWAPCR